LAAERRIVAVGGGGFVSPVDAPLVELLFGLGRSDARRICLVPTAGGDNLAYVAAYYRTAIRFGAVPVDLPLFMRTGEDLRSVLLDQDVIWVSGGNTANMLAIWRLHGVDVALREAWEAGVVLAGSSAGMLCWFEASITDSFGPQLAPLHDGLGFLPGSACPHYDGEALRRPVYREAVAGGCPGGYAADDGAALVFSGESLEECVGWRPGARCWRVERDGDEVVERPLDTRAIG
jgi:peptidase E